MIATRAESSSNYYRDNFFSSVGGQISLSGSIWHDIYVSGGFAVSLGAVFSYVFRNIGSRVFS